MIRAHRRLRLVAYALLATAAPGTLLAGYYQTNLVSDVPGRALRTDPNLVNPWGISASPTGPFWVSDNGTGVSTLYGGAGNIVPLVVTVPPAHGGTGPGSPTGQVFNGTTDFQVATNKPAVFLFASLDGTISGWNPTVPAAGSTVAQRMVTAANAVYTGLAIGNNGAGNFLYAANALGGIDAYNASFAKATLPGGFSDASVPSGFTPYNIQNLNGSLYVTYGTEGKPGGVVDRFDLNGNLLGRIATNGALNDPWGLAIAPSNFGELSNSLLVGNFGDGQINAYDPITGVFRGTLTGTSGDPISIQGL